MRSLSYSKAGQVSPPGPCCPVHAPERTERTLRRLVVGDGDSTGPGDRRDVLEDVRIRARHVDRIVDREKPGGIVEVVGALDGRLVVGRRIRPDFGRIAG